jgi:hypothetical protein
MECEFAEITGTDYIVTANYDIEGGRVATKDISVNKESIGQFYLGQRLIVLV